MKTKIVFLIAAALLTPVALQAQSASAKSTAQAQAQAKTPEARIDAAMSAAARARIPASLLKSKVDEGRAKQVPQDRIATAVEARLEALVSASQAMRDAKIDAFSESELAVAGDAVQAGVNQKALVKVYRDAPAERRVVAVAVLTDLVRLGKGNEHALARVSAAVRSNAALAGLQAEVASELRRGGLGATLHGNGLVRIK